jgi:hypothetical protein
MLKFKIKTHKLGNTYKCPHFFILNKGQNSGKPAVAHWSNCYVFLADDEGEKDFYFFVFLGLWELGYFKKAIIGSVVPFIRIDDVTNIAEEAINNINTGNRQWDDIKGVMLQLEEKKTVLLQQVDHIIKIRKTMLYNFVKR